MSVWDAKREPCPFGYYKGHKAFFLESTIIEETLITSRTGDKVLISTKEATGVSVCPSTLLEKLLRGFDGKIQDTSAMMRGTIDESLEVIHITIWTQELFEGRCFLLP